MISILVLNLLNISIGHLGLAFVCSICIVYNVDKALYSIFMHIIFVGYSYKMNP